MYLEQICYLTKGDINNISNYGPVSLPRIFFDLKRYFTLSTAIYESRCASFVKMFFLTLKTNNRFKNNVINNFFQSNQLLLCIRVAKRTK